MEMQFFVKPGTDMEWFERLDGRAHAVAPGRSASGRRSCASTSTARTSWRTTRKAAFDIEYEFPFGWQEFEGIHNRTDFDLSRHQEYSGKKLEYFDAGRQRALSPLRRRDVGGRRPRGAGGAGGRLPRGGGRGRDARVVLGSLPSLAPIKAAVFPLVKKDGMPEMARRIYDDLRGRYNVFYDDGGSIGRRYRRQDEAGTPFCITVDGQIADGSDGDGARPRHVAAGADRGGRVAGLSSGQTPVVRVAA